MFHKTDSIKILEMVYSDVEKVLEIEQECKLCGWTKRAYEEEITKQESIALVAKKGLETIGFLIARLTAETEIEKCFSEAAIYNIGVAENYQNIGVGNLLLKRFLLIARKCKTTSVWLEVRESNGTAISFYKKNGFEEIQKRNNFYTHPPEHAIIMKLEVSDIYNS